MRYRFHEFLVKRTVLALEVQHGYRLGRWGGILRRVRRGFHHTMVPAVVCAPSHAENWVRLFPGSEARPFECSAKQPRKGAFPLGGKGFPPAVTVVVLNTKGWSANI
jgi:hypothetical protein